MVHSCCCTNQCPSCGQCCQVACGHRHAAHGVSIGIPAAAPPVIADELRRIVREEIDARLGALRDADGS